MAAPVRDRGDARGSAAPKLATFPLRRRARKFHGLSKALEDASRRKAGRRGNTQVLRTCRLRADARRSKAATPMSPIGRANAVASTSVPTMIRSPPESTISIRLAGAALRILVTFEAPNADRIKPEWLS